MADDLKDISWNNVKEDLSEQNLEDRPEKKGASSNVQHPTTSKERSQNLDLILDIPLQVSVELGRSKMMISDLLKLIQGSVIELNKPVGDPMDVLINGKEVARGEAVVINERFGVRLTEIINPLERIKQLVNDK